MSGKKERNAWGQFSNETIIFSLKEKAKAWFLNNLFQLLFPQYQLKQSLSILNKQNIFIEVCFPSQNRFETFKQKNNLIYILLLPTYPGKYIDGSRAVIV